MAPNTLPIWSRGGVNSNNGSTGMNQLITAAAADYTGVHANYSLVWTSDASNGGFLRYLRFKAGGTNVVSVARIFLNNGNSPGTASNNMFIGEQSLPAITATNTAATSDIDWAYYQSVEPGFRIYVGLATAVAAGWVVVPFGGKY